MGKNSINATSSPLTTKSSAKSLVALLSALLVIPATCAYLISIITTLHPPLIIPSSIVLLWIMIETLFYINFVYSRNRLQAHIKPNIPLTKQQRTALFWNCVHTIKDIKTWSEGWFYYADDYTHPSITDIKRDNFALWYGIMQKTSFFVP
jgi:hypothetical protein